MVHLIDMNRLDDGVVQGLDIYEIRLHGFRLCLGLLILQCTNLIVAIYNLTLSFLTGFCG